MSSIKPGDELAAPFFGFVAGCVLLGVTILQACQYYLRYPDDSRLCKLKVAVVCLLDLLHFVFSVDLMYTFLISNFGIPQASASNVWSVKALATIQAVLIVLVQLIYLRRIYTLSSIPALNSQMFTNLMFGIISVIAICAIGVGIVFCVQLHKIKVIVSFGDDSEWVVYLGFGATAAIDVIIAAMMCIVLHKTRLDIGLDYISQRSDRMLSSLANYVVGTGLVTSFVAILEIVLYLARPDTLIYFAVTFSVTRLYANSLLAMFNMRRQFSTEPACDLDLKPPSGIVFAGAPSMRTRKRRNACNMSMPIPRESRTHRVSTGSSSDSDSDYDVEGHHENGSLDVVVDLYSPYFSPLEARKHGKMMLPPKEDKYNWANFWKTRRRSWFGWTVDRRSTL